jgi:toxic protein SymE
MSRHSSATPNNEAARQKLWWHKPKSVMTNALHHDGLETYPGCPPIPCLKLRGLWIHALGIEPGTRLYVETNPGTITLSTHAPVATDAPAVEYRRLGRGYIALDKQ